MTGSLPKFVSAPFWNPFGKNSIAHDPATGMMFLVDEKWERTICSYICKEAKMEGNSNYGVIYSQKLELGPGDSFWKVNSNEAWKTLPEGSSHLSDNLQGISCILQKGESENICDIALESVAAPFITYGSGSGLRDNLGLLRITIPAEKEILRFVVNRDEVPYFLSMMIKRGSLDQPGRGFIFTWPISFGSSALNPTAESKSAASTEQIIAAIDSLQGDITWRKKVAFNSVQKYQFFEGVDLTLCCNEGSGRKLVTAAMDAGLGGATVEQWKLLSPSGDPNQVSRARELCLMTLDPAKLDAVLGNMKSNQAFESVYSGAILQGKVPQAFTYLAKSS